MDPLKSALFLFFSYSILEDFPDFIEITGIFMVYFFTVHSSLFMLIF